MRVVIGVDPHKGSHTAVAIDANEQQLAQIQVSSQQLVRAGEEVLDVPATLASRVRVSATAACALGVRSVGRADHAVVLRLLATL